MMLWTVLIAAAAGGLAALIARLVVGGDVTGNRTRYSVALVIAFTVLNGTARAVAIPRILAAQVRTQVDQVLHENRAFAILVKAHPEIGQQLEAAMVDIARRGGTAEEARAKARDWGRNTLGPYFGKYAPRASDESLGRYVGTLVTMLDDMNAQDPRACYGLLFGQASEGDSLTISDDQQAKIVDAMADVLESAMNDPHAPTPPAEAAALTQELVERLRASHGQEFVASLAALAQPQSPSVDRAKVCSVATEMYREVLKMPAGRRGSLLRHLLAA